MQEGTRVKRSIFRLGIAALLGGVVTMQAWNSVAHETPPASRRPARKTTTRVVRLSANDVLGEPVRLGPGTHAPVTVVFFVSHKSEKQSEQLATEVDQKLSDRPLARVTVVDAHKYNGILKGEATKRLKKAAEKTRLQRQKQLAERPARASRKSVDRWYLVGDFDGSWFNAFGLPRDTPLPVAFVVARSGTLSGPYREATAVAAAASGRKTGARHARTPSGTRSAKPRPE
jgi:hypothetical protein